VELVFLSPIGGLLALLALVPLAALALVSARARSVRAAMGLSEPERSSALRPALTIAAIAGLVALGAAQPVLARVETTVARTDAQVIFVLDVSRSMLASVPGGETRFERARAAAIRLRNEIADVPVGVASLTDRALPHLFPTTDASAFAATVRSAIGIERPPPAGFWTVATTFQPLMEFESRNFFAPGLKRRVLVVFTDGEARPTDAVAVRHALSPDAGFRILFIRFWSARERIFGPRGRRDPGYAPAPESGAALAGLARSLGGAAFDEDELERAGRALRADVGRGPRVRRADRVDPIALAPYLAGAAFAPLLLLLWGRNRA
jgi:hypothetical protein